MREGGFQKSTRQRGVSPARRAQEIFAIRAVTMKLFCFFQINLYDK